MQSRLDWRNKATHRRRQAVYTRTRLLPAAGSVDPAFERKSFHSLSKPQLWIRLEAGALLRDELGSEGR